MTETSTRRSHDGRRGRKNNGDKGLGLLRTTLLSATLSRTRSELLRTLVNIDVGSILEESRNRPEKDREGVDEIEAKIASLSLLLEVTVEEKRRRILERKLLHTVSFLRLDARHLRRLADAQQGDSVVSRLQIEEIEIADQLVTANQGLVRKVLKKCATSHFEESDLVQEGNIGLMTAVVKFDFRRGTSFSTYAMNWVRQAISRAIQDREQMVRVPIHIQELCRKIAASRIKFAKEHGREPTDKELVKLVEREPHAIKKALAILDDREGQTLLLLDRPSGEGDAVMGDFFAAVEPSPLENVLAEEEIDAVQEIIGTLKDERDRKIIKMRFGVDHVREYTLEEIGSLFGVTRERIRQIEEKVLAKLKKRGLAGRLAELVRRPEAEEPAPIEKQQYPVATLDTAPEPDHESGS